MPIRTGRTRSRNTTIPHLPISTVQTLVKFHGRTPSDRMRPHAVGQKIEQDLQRFRKIVRGKVKSNLSKYISRGEMIGKKGNDLVSIPIPSIQLPQFRYGQKGSGGVGVGEGKPGQPLSQP